MIGAGEIVGSFATIASVCLILTSGCTHKALQQTTLSQGSSITDILADEALSNLEMFRQNPDALPWHVKITTGSASVGDKLEPSFVYDSPSIGRIFGLSANRQWSLTWTIVPTLNTGELLALRDIYRCAATSGRFVDPQAPERRVCGADEPDFDATFVEGLTPPVTLNSGSFRGTSIWVRRGHEAALSRLILRVLSSAKIQPEERTFQLPASLTLSPP